MNRLPLLAAALPGLVLALAGCASPPQPPAKPAPLANLALTPADLKKAEQRAYDAGFAAGRRYQSRRDAAALSASLTATQMDCPSGSAAASSPAQAPVPVPVPVPVPAPAAPPAASYTPSGAARPLSP
ncbi:hypothetical protein [Acidocella sp.]|uniref:hypothetical protein n=1 Tax=Acidocella sp. TaxID=50710 RepID=UPI002608B9F8|nr:hypothetical protein [Acidocella sp.]